MGIRFAAEGRAMGLQSEYPLSVTFSIQRRTSGPWEEIGEFEVDSFSELVGLMQAIQDMSDNARVIAEDSFTGEYIAALYKR